jgi:hypothetical protein
MTENNLNLLALALLALCRFGWEKLRVNERHNTTLRDDNVTKKFVQPKHNLENV